MNKSGTNRQLEKRISALENAGATMKTTSILARLREENANLRADNISLQAANLALVAATFELRAELEAIKNPGERAEAGRTDG